MQLSIACTKTCFATILLGCLAVSLGAQGQTIAINISQPGTASIEQWSSKGRKELLDAIRAHWIQQPFLVVGVMHGSNEAPDFVFSLLAIAPSSTPVILALEVPSDEQEAIDKFIDSDGNDVDRHALLSGAFWNAEFQDGRRSAAMARLVDNVRALRRHGAHIRIVCFDNSSFDPANRDRSMAIQMKNIISGAKNSYVLALTGNEHARMDKAGNQLSFVQHLASLKPWVLVISSHYGKVWACMANACGPQTAPGGEADDGKDTAMLRVTSADHHVHDVLLIPRLSMSLPAITVR